MNNLRKFQQLLEGVTQEDLADILCARLETRYPDIYNKYDYNTVYRAVDDVASFHSGAEELGTSDIGMMLRSVIKRLEEYQGVAEGTDKYGFHTSVSKGKFLPSKYGQDENNLYLHDLMNVSGDGSGPQLVTISDKRIATEIAAMYGGYVEKTGMGTYRVYQPKGTGQSVKQPELTGVAEGLAEAITSGNYNVGLEDIGKPVLLDGEKGYVLLHIERHGGSGKLVAKLLRPKTGSKGYYDLSSISRVQQGVAEGSEDPSYKKGWELCNKDPSADPQHLFRKHGEGLDRNQFIKGFNDNAKSRGMRIHGDVRGDVDHSTLRYKEFKRDQGVAEDLKDKLFVSALGAATLGGIGTTIHATPPTYVNGIRYEMAFKTPANAKLTTDDKGRKIYIWTSKSTHPKRQQTHRFYRPAEKVDEQGVAEGLSSDKNMSALQKVVDTAAKYGFKMSNRSKNGQKIILHNTDFHQWMTCRIRNINGKIYIDYDESSNINGLRNEVVTPSEFIQRLKNYYLKGQAWLEKIRKRDAAEKNFVGIRVEQYPYGKPSSGLRAAVKFLNRNGKRGHEYFDFPEYADIPDEISNQLMPEEVDFIQDRWDEVPVGKQGVAEEQLDELKCWDGYKRVPGTKSGAPGSCEKINELSTEKLAQYKKAAGADARKADKEGDFEHGNKRFRGIVKATKKQFDNETKPKRESAIMKGIVDETLGTPYPGTYEQENKPFMRKGPKRTMKLTTEGNKNVGR